MGALSECFLQVCVCILFLFLLLATKTSKMNKAHPPELKKFVDKKLLLKLNGGRSIEGILCGFDPFMNLVIDEAVGKFKSGRTENVGMVVVRGNSILMMESMERI